MRWYLVSVSVVIDIAPFDQRRLRPVGQAVKQKERAPTLAPELVVVVSATVVASSV
jgi:hypothetical protein